MLQAGRGGQVEASPGRAHPGRRRKEECAEECVYTGKSSVDGKSEKGRSRGKGQPGLSEDVGESSLG